MEFDESSTMYVTINTQKGLYVYNRLVFGIKSALAIWQRAMHQVLQGPEGTQCYLGDILVTGKNDQEHFTNLEGVLLRIHKFGL